MLLAAAVVSGFGVFLHSFTESVNEAVGDLVTADLVVDSETFTRGGLPADLVDQLAFVDGVEAVSGWELGRATVSGMGVRMTGLDGSTALDVVEPDWDGEAPKSLDGSSAWISASLAERSGLGVGDALPAVFTSGGFESLAITGVYRTGEALLGDAVTDRVVLERQVPATIDLAALLRTDGSDKTEAAVSDLAASYGVTAVSSPETFVDQRSELLRGFQRVVQWMLLFTLLQALVGVVNTLTLSVGERRREFGLLRVSGASRRQVMRMVLFEGASLAAVGTVLGLGVGVGGAAAAIWALGSLGLGVFSVPVLTVVTIGAAALVVGIAAAWLPARVAANVAPLEAVTDSGVEFAGQRPPAAIEPAVAIIVVPTTPAPSAPVLLPPPFDPARLAVQSVAVQPVAVQPAAFQPAANQSSGAPQTPVAIPAGALLAVAVWDGNSVISLDPRSDEAAALLSLYGVSAEETATRFAQEAPAPVFVAPVPVESEPPVWAPVHDVPFAIARVLGDHETGLIDLGLQGTESVDAARPQQESVTPERPEPVVAERHIVEPPVAEPELVEPVAVEDQRVEAEQVDVVSGEILADAEPEIEEDIAAVDAEVVQPGPFATEPSVPSVTEPAAQAQSEPAGPAKSADQEPAPEQAPEMEVPAAATPNESGGDAGAASEEPAHGTRRGRRDRSGARIPRRRSRRAAAPSNAAEGWVVPDPRSAGASGPADHTTPGAPGSPEPEAEEVDRRSAELSAALAALDPETVRMAATALNGVGGALAVGEHVGAVVCGRVKSWPAAVSRTDRRLLVVVDRPGRLLFESLHPVATAVSLRPGVGGSVILVLVDQGRLLELTDVSDVLAAEALLTREALSS